MGFDYEQFEKDCNAAGGKYIETESDYNGEYGNTKTASCEFDMKGEPTEMPGERRSIIVQDRSDKPYVTAKSSTSGRSSGIITNPAGSMVEYPNEMAFRSADATGIPARKKLKIVGDEQQEAVTVQGEPASKGKGEKTRRRRV